MLNGPITLNANADIKIRGIATGTLNIRGGVTGNYNLATFSDVGGVDTFVFETSPVSIGTGEWYGGNFSLNMAGNTANALTVDWGKTIRMGVDNPFTSAPALVFGSQWALNGIDLNGHTFTARSLWAADPAKVQLTDSSGGAPGTFVLDTAVGNTFDGKISGNLQLTKQSSGWLALGGANTYTGLTTVTAGILQATSTTALGATGAGTVINFNGGTTTGGQIRLSGGVNVAEPFTIQGSGEADPWKQPS